MHGRREELGRDQRREHDAQSQPRPMSAANIAAQADPPIRLLDAAAMDYLLIEAVTALRDSAAVATARAKKIENEMVEAGILAPPPPAKEPNRKGLQVSARRRGGGGSQSKTRSDRNARRRQLFRTVRTPLGALPLLMCPQTLQGQASFHGNTRCHQVRVQGPVGRMLGETG